MKIVLSTLAAFGKNRKLKESSAFNAAPPFRIFAPLLLLPPPLPPIFGIENIFLGIVGGVGLEILDSSCGLTELMLLVNCESFDLFARSWLLFAVDLEFISAITKSTGLSEVPCGPPLPIPGFSGSYNSEFRTVAVVVAVALLAVIEFCFSLGLGSGGIEVGPAEKFKDATTGGGAGGGGTLIKTGVGNAIAAAGGKPGGGPHTGGGRPANKLLSLDAHIQMNVITSLPLEESSEMIPLKSLRRRERNRRFVALYCRRL
ncbi:hypothetical protein GQX74_013820 [Glossina fuscipes]|uniref:Uncharacterized protein n=1 Tax=Glossina palpalis gambiensis TaxID=67801 RepID=A0A1B0BLV3_9MUSC|nr:hypothetical protein GQX74_013820 [Glossina fuscipes]